MDLFEYQGKSLYQDYDISHPKSSLVKDPKELQELKGLSYPVVVKAQVQVGGRGKAGGIKVANNHDELIELGNQIYGMDIKGHKVEVLLIEEASEILEEYYLSFTLDRSAKKYLMMLSSKGGMDIEQVATGEYWLASKALELKLVDELLTSDDYLHSKMEEGFDVIEIRTVEERKPLERLLQQGTQLFQRVLQSRLPLPDSQPLDVREYYR